VLDFDKIEKLIEDGYITKRKHPTKSLWILNYSSSTQYERNWTEETLSCRGLVVDKHNNIVARPFKKFFNYDEWVQMGNNIPNEPFEVYEKLDGSLGVGFWYEGQFIIATRGSFESEQAIEANKIWNEKYKDTASTTSLLTYLFEIIYPENRIVVDYKGKRDLVLLTVIETETGEELKSPHLSFPSPIKYDGLDYDTISKLDWENHEGFVLKFQSGLRLKIKHENYKRLHKILTGLNELAIWEMLKDGKSVDSLINDIPDEFYKWVKEVADNLEIEFNIIEDYAERHFSGLDLYLHHQNKTSRKDYAEEITKYFHPYPSIMFNLLDNKDYNQTIWKWIRPKQVKKLIKENE